MRGRRGVVYPLEFFSFLFLFSGIRDPKFLARGQNLTVHRSYLRLNIAYRLLMAGGYMNPAALDIDKKLEFFSRVRLAINLSEDNIKILFQPTVYV